MALRYAYLVAPPLGGQKEALLEVAYRRLASGVVERGYTVVRGTAAGLEYKLTVVVLMPNFGGHIVGCRMLPGTEDNVNAVRGSWVPELLEHSASIVSAAVAPFVTAVLRLPHHRLPWCIEPPRGLRSAVTEVRVLENGALLVTMDEGPADPSFAPMPAVVHERYVPGLLPRQ